LPRPANQTTVSGRRRGAWGAHQKL
jgi:hypothetical protein